MPQFKAPESPKCPKCGRSVYAAEEKVAGGYKWHKVCFKCDLCNKMLDSTSCAEHDRKLYCKTCYGRKYGPKGVGFGAGAGALSMDTGSQFGNTESVTNGNHIGQDVVIPAPSGQGCPRCGGYVYHADQVFSKGRPWHKSCFKCNACHRVLDSRIACDGPDRDVYCNGCYRKRYGLKGYGPVLTSGNTDESIDCMPGSARYVDTTAIPAGPGEDGCPRCGGQVFHAERMLGSKGKAYHKVCFTCGVCKQPLDSVLCCDGPDGDIYCKRCYSRMFGAKGYGFGCGAGFLKCADGQDSNSMSAPAVNTATIRGEQGGKDTCPRCGGQVFHAERMLSRSSVFHRACFSCFDCKRHLDSTQCCDSPDGEIFCRLCYAKHFGPKGYGFGGTGSVPALITSSSFAHNPEDRIQMDFLPGDQETKARDGKGCLRCGHSVYEAEKLIAADKAWHKRCFTCSVCNRHLDSVTVNDGPDGDIYCKTCYSAQFGLQGYGFGQGAGTLLSDSGRFGNDPQNRLHTESAFILP